MVYARWWAAAAILLLGVTPEVAFTEGTIQLQKKYGPRWIYEEQAKTNAPSIKQPTAEENLPRLLEDVENLKTGVLLPRNPTKPRTAKEAMSRLYEIGTEIERVTSVVEKFGRSRTKLEEAITRLALNERRNQVYVSGWAPVLLGNLRLLKAREGQALSEFWVIAALVILESQVARLDQRIQQSASLGKLTNMLNNRQNEMDQKRSELRISLSEIRLNLQTIRQKALTEIQMRS